MPLERWHLSEHAEMGAAMLSAVDRLFSSPRFSPPVLPRAAVQLVQLTRRPEVDFKVVAALVESDPFFAALVLRAANSSLYGGLPISSIEHALVRLGLSTMSDICLEVAMNGRVFRAPGMERTVEDLLLRGRATAHAARLLCERSGQGAGPGFAAGLLHNVGVLAALVATNTPGLCNCPAPQVLEAACARHDTLVAVVARAWRMPRDLQDALQDHHRSDRELDAASAALLVAERVVDELELPSTHPLTSFYSYDDERQLRAAEKFGVRDSDLPKLATALRERLIASCA